MEIPKFKFSLLFLGALTLLGCAKKTNSLDENQSVSKSYKNFLLADELGEPALETEDIEDDTLGLEAPRSMKPIIQMGQRAYKLLEMINKAYSQDSMTQTDSEITNAPEYTPENPLKYGPRTIFANYDEFLKNVPKEFKKLLISAEEPLEPPSEESLSAYMFWSNYALELYDTALRWQLKKQAFEDLKKAKYRDVRGIYFLEKEPDLDQKLMNWSKNSQEDQKRLTSFLINICENSNVILMGINGSCPQLFQQAVEHHNVKGYYSVLRPTAKLVLDRYFMIADANLHNEIHIQSSNTFVMPFLNPGKGADEFFKKTIEAAWNWNDWKIVIDYQLFSSSHITFMPDVLAHADAVGGTEIVLNSKASMDDDFGIKILQHEFGHLLGFPDCYVEFFDENEQLIVYYELDQQNIMCSKTGKVTAKHLSELRRVYGSNSHLGSN